MLWAWEMGCIEFSAAGAEGLKVEDEGGSVGEGEGVGELVIEDGPGGGGSRGGLRGNLELFLDLHGHEVRQRCEAYEGVS